MKTLRKIEAIKELRIGVVASTEKRDVVDNSWAVSELMFFEDLAGQATYQDHPIHQKFIKDCSHLWDNVFVYDAMDVLATEKMTRGVSMRFETPRLRLKDTLP